MKQSQIEQFLPNPDNETLQEVLDELVIEAHCQRASNLNNEGIDSQLCFLEEEWGLTETVKAIIEALVQAKEELSNED